PRRRGGCYLRRSRESSAMSRFHRGGAGSRWESDSVTRRRARGGRDNGTETSKAMPRSAPAIRGPDETTGLRFRRLPATHRRATAIWEAVKELPTVTGLSLTDVQIIDTTIPVSPSVTSPATQARRPGPGYRGCSIHCPTVTVGPIPSRLSRKRVLHGTQRRSVP